MSKNRDDMTIEELLERANKRFIQSMTLTSIGIVASAVGVAMLLKNNRK